MQTLASTNEKCALSNLLHGDLLGQVISTYRLFYGAEFSGALVQSEIASVLSAHRVNAKVKLVLLVQRDQGSEWDKVSKVDQLQ